MAGASNFVPPTPLELCGGPGCTDCYGRYADPYPPGGLQGSPWDLHPLPPTPPEADHVSTLLDDDIHR
eukprot:99916-Prymnesium_polylepis.1